MATGSANLLICVFLLMCIKLGVRYTVAMLLFCGSGLYLTSIGIYHLEALASICSIVRTSATTHALYAVCAYANSRSVFLHWTSTS